MVLTRRGFLKKSAMAAGATASTGYLADLFGQAASESPEPLAKEVARYVAEKGGRQDSTSDVYKNTGGSKKRVGFVKTQYDRPVQRDVNGDYKARTIFIETSGQAFTASVALKAYLGEGDKITYDNPHNRLSILQFRDSRNPKGMITGYTTDIGIDGIVDSGRITDYTDLTEVEIRENMPSADKERIKLQKYQNDALLNVAQMFRDSNIEAR